MGPMFSTVKVKGCNRCGGDLVLDDGDWRCWQCGQYYYAGSPDHADGTFRDPSEERAASVHSDHTIVSSSGPMYVEAQPPRRPRTGYGARSARNINSVIRAKKTSDERWWVRNRQIIEYLDQGLSVREIAIRVERSERQIRVVRERLTELRASTDETAFAKE